VRIRFFREASLCFGLTKTLLFEAKHPAGLINLTDMKRIKNRNTNGRPSKSLSEKKSYKVTVKMATEEFYTLKAKANFAGINHSEFIRRCICSSVVKQRLTPQLMGYIRKLCGMANNVNQIARTANTVGYSNIHSECISMTKNLDRLIKRIENDC
jgi:predicted DNA binding CopG/RHH family protein